MPSSGGGGGGGTAPPTTTTTNNTTTNNSTTQLSPEALALQQQALANQATFFNNIANSISTPGPFYYPGELAAPLAPQSVLANALATQSFSDPRAYSSQPLANLSALYATSPGPAGTIAQQTALQQYMSSPQFLDPRSNPFTAAAADAANRQTVNTLVNQALPAIKSSAVTAGQFGGSRQGVAEGQAVAGAAQAIADTTAKYFFDQYNENMKASLQSQALTPGTISLPQALIDQAINARGAANQQMIQNFATLDTAGKQLQGFAQQLLDGEVTRWQFNNTIGLTELSIYAGIAGALTDPASYGAGSTTSSTGTTVGTQTTTGQLLPYTSPFLGALGGAAAGASIGSMFAGATKGSTLGVPGAIIGGLLGLFL